MKKSLCFLLSLCLLFALLLPGCTQDPGQGSTGPQTLELNIVDDNYRNWYEIFVHSFYDTNNDGIGDLNGVTEKLDYVQEMGFNGIWLMPIHPSPTYHKYDVTDYYAVDPAYGALEDLDRLIEEAHKRGIRVILDLVVNHSSDSHPWFKEACAYIRQNGVPGGEYGEYYKFTTEKPAGYSPVSGTSYHYEARFWSGMPDLNLDSEKVRAEIVDIMDFWMTEHHVDGFRLDAVTSYYYGDLQKNVAFLNWLNTEAKKIKPDCYIVGEAWVGTDAFINDYYQSGVDSFFLFTGSQGTGTLATIVKQQNGKAYGKLQTDLQATFTSGVLAPFLGNHDTMRPGSFMPGEENVKMAGGALAMMNGSTFVYYGEEIGMISKGGNNSDPAKRIAMKWAAKNIYPGCCYLPPENTPVDDTYYYYPSVEEQQADPNSILNYYKAAMRLRNCFPSIARGRVENFSPAGNTYISILKKTWQEETVIIVMNFDSFEQTVALESSLGITEGIMGGLYAQDVSVEASYDAATGSIVLPPYSIVILK